jgi:hypothetical protein
LDGGSAAERGGERITTAGGDGQSLPAIGALAQMPLQLFRFRSVHQSKQEILHALAVGALEGGHGNYLNFAAGAGMAP